MNNTLFSQPDMVGKLDKNRLAECSGLDYSFRNQGMFWSHNDSGDEPVLFLLNPGGGIEMEVFMEGIQNVDWEDITVAPPYLYIADIGDNSAIRNNLFIYRISEPFLKDKKLVISKDSISTMVFSYEEGPRDAETLLYDFQFEKLIIVTKRERNCLVYPFSYQASDHVVILAAGGSFPLTNFTAGDANSDGEILLKTYHSIFYWGASGEPLFEKILRGPDFMIPYKREPQGEAICWDDKGNFYTVGESISGQSQPIYFYKRGIRF